MPHDEGRFSGGANAGAVRIGAAIVGAQKCGTTSLAAALAGHPRVCLARNKEAHLFDDEEVQRRGPTPAELEAHFSHREPGQILLDATPSYLYLPGCIDALVRHSPDVRVIVVLRNPAERALSHLAHSTSVGSETLPPFRAVWRERRRLAADSRPLAPNSPHRAWSYVERSDYAPQLRRLISLAEHVHVVMFGDMIGDPGQTLTGIHRFLSLDESPTALLPHLNISARRRHPAARTVVKLKTRHVAAETAKVLGVPASALRW